MSESLSINRPTRAIDLCASAFIDCELHAQDAIALAAYVRYLESRLATPKPAEDAQAPDNEAWVRACDAAFERLQSSVGPAILKTVARSAMRAVLEAGIAALRSAPAAQGVSSLTDAQIDIGHAPKNLSWSDARVWCVGYDAGFAAALSEVVSESAPSAQEAMRDRLLSALERASAAETALRNLVDECDNDKVLGWEARMGACIDRANKLLAASESGVSEPVDQPDFWWSPARNQLLAHQSTAKWPHGEWTGTFEQGLKSGMTPLFTRPQPGGDAARKALERVRGKLVRMGAKLPIEVKGTVESAIQTGHSHALLLVEEELAVLAGGQTGEEA